MPNHLLLMRGHRVEDRTTFSGEGEVAFVRPDGIGVRFVDGSFETIKPELFEEIGDGEWAI